MSENIVPLNREQLELLDVLKEMPPVNKPEVKLIDKTHQDCAACKKATYVGDFKIFDSGVIHTAISPLCSACQNTFGDCAKLVCCSCRTVIGWMEPHTDKDGFSFEKYHSYHIQTCPSCTPGLEKADIIEKIIYFRQNNKPYIS